MKTALITGASSEIGLSLAKKLEDNYNLILIKHKNNIDTSNLEKKPLIYTCDFNNKKSLRKLIKKLKNIKIDLIINAAAYDQNEDIDKITNKEIIKAFQINTITPFILIKELLKKEDAGVVINIASTDGIDTYNEYNLPYAISKSALIHLTKQLNYIYKNINFYALCPNYINTKSVQIMEPIYLKEELKRVNQEKLLEVEEVTDKIIEIINELPNEIVIRME